MLFLAESSAIMYNDYRVVAGAVTRLDVLSVSFSGSSSLERRYEFTKRIDITLRGYAMLINRNDNYIQRCLCL